MQAAIIHKPFEIEIETVPDPSLRAPTDAIVRVVLTCICGSDLWQYRGIHPSEPGSRMGHEFLGVVEAIGPDVRRLRIGDVVVAPFLYSDGTCVHCQEGRPTSCIGGGGWGWNGVDGGQGEFVRVPVADGTLVVAPVTEQDARLPALLTLSDVMCTGHHAARSAGVAAGSVVAVVGDGAVGLCGVLAALRLGAARIIVLGHHADRIAIAVHFGATDVVSEIGAEAIARVKDMTDGLGVAHVLECVGTEGSWQTALGISRPGGTVGYVGVPAHSDLGVPLRSFFGANISIRGGLAPARRYLPELVADVLDGTLDPSPVFDLDVSFQEIPAGYRSMHERTAIKTLVRL